MEKIILSNGLRLLLVPQKESPTVTALILVGAGSKYETKEINGLSHFLEHMLFKGTEKRPTPLEIALTLDQVGGSYNAFTGQEYTGYFAKVQAKHFPLALDWVSDIFLHPLLPAEALEREKGVILEERNMYLDTPSQYIGEVWEKLLYGDQPAGWEIIGREEVIRGANREKLAAYFQSHYSSQNTVLALAGQLGDKEKIQAEVEKIFKEMNQKAPAEKLPVKEEQDKPQSLIHFKKTDQSHLAIGVRGYDNKDERQWTQAVLSTILGGNMSSRLFTVVREKNGLAYYVRTSSRNYTDSGYLTTQAGIANQKVEKAIQLILAEYKKVLQGDVSEAEVKKGKEYLKGSLALSLETSDGLAVFYAQQELIEPTVLSPEEIVKKIDEVTLEKVNQVAQDLFKPEKLNLALIGPYHQGDFSGILEL
jgi:predicted Zn-dependent peptidase